MRYWPPLPLPPTQMESVLTLVMAIMEVMEKNQPNCHICKNIHGADHRHPHKKCWIDYPHLEAEWEAANPEKAIARNARISAQGRTDPTTRLAIVNEPVPVMARMVIQGTTSRAGSEFY